MLQPFRHRSTEERKNSPTTVVRFIRWVEALSHLSIFFYFSSFAIPPCLEMGLVADFERCPGKRHLERMTIPRATFQKLWVQRKPCSGELNLPHPNGPRRKMDRGKKRKSLLLKSRKGRAELRPPHPRFLRSKPPRV